MASHTALYRKLRGAVRGEKVQPLRLAGGTLNYKKMDKATIVIVDGTNEAQADFMRLLHEQERIGHLTLEGPNGVACETGAPGMHWTFNAASVMAVLLWAIENKKGLLRDACVRWLANEFGLDRAYRFGQQVAFPCPRVKDDDPNKDEEDDMAPLDGYRDVALALALGENPRKPEHYWQSEQALAVDLMRRLQGKLSTEEKLYIARAPVPKLYMPIERQNLPEGGALLKIADTPQARRAMGQDCCNWVAVVRILGSSKFKITWGTDWEPAPVFERNPMTPTIQ